MEVVMKKYNATKWSKDRITNHEKLKIAFQLAGCEGVTEQIKKHKKYLLEYINLRPLQIAEVIENNNLLLA